MEQEFDVEIKEVLSRVQKVKAESLDDAINKASKDRLRRICNIFKNTFRELFDKKAKDYSKIDKRIKMSDLFKKSWMAKQSILESMEKRIDRAIVKVDSLHKEAELNNMLIHTFKS